MLTELKIKKDTNKAFWGQFWDSFKIQVLEQVSVKVYTFSFDVFLPVDDITSPAYYVVEEACLGVYSAYPIRGKF